MSDIKRIKFILEKIEYIESFINKFNSIVYLLEDKMGFDATLFSFPSSRWECILKPTQLKITTYIRIPNLEPGS